MKLYINLHILFFTALLFALTLHTNQKTINEMELTGKVLHSEIMGLQRGCGLESVGEIYYQAGREAVRTQ